MTIDHFVKQIADHAISGRWDRLPAPIVHACKRRSSIRSVAPLQPSTPNRAGSRAPSPCGYRSAKARGILGTEPQDTAGIGDLRQRRDGALSRRQRCLSRRRRTSERRHRRRCSRSPMLSVADGGATIAAIALGYDVHYALFHALRVFDKGLDHPFYTAVATAAAAARLLDLNEAHRRSTRFRLRSRRTSRSVRRGGEASRCGRAALPAMPRVTVFSPRSWRRAGMTGPERPAEGPLASASFSADRGCRSRTSQSFRILQADMKYFVTEFHSIAPVMMATRLAEGHAVDDIEAIAIATYKFAYEEIGSGPEKWRPTTRETADHSMPYIVAAALVNGGFSDAIFEPARFADRANPAFGRQDHHQGRPGTHPPTARIAFRAAWICASQVVA